jgi:hypothetical protein
MTPRLHQLFNDRSALTAICWAKSPTVIFSGTVHVVNNFFSGLLKTVLIRLIAKASYDGFPDVHDHARSRGLNITHREVMTTLLAARTGTRQPAPDALYLVGDAAHLGVSPTVF